ncbi:heme oxygenase [Novosphingobium sp. BL-52-GroH]|uniref:heme oxygenase n=1 Tax=Novosphingobium sp. BL-52-GroH TaxID=3349877 RepID=UPI00384E6585
MPADAGTPVLPDMLSILREATGPSHERLDALFGSLALSRRRDLARFLAAHAIGLAPMFPVFRRFVGEELGLDCPDYPAMLRADLAALGTDPDALPVLDVPAAILPDEAAAGVGYVICGSRLGLTVIRQQGYWGEAEGFRSAYMTDGRGHEAWKALVPRLRGLRPAAGPAETARAAALAAFDTFARAFAASHDLGRDLGPAERLPVDG